MTSALRDFVAIDGAQRFLLLQIHTTMSAVR